jgi:ABC-type transport system substrate-binding protein
VSVSGNQLTISLTAADDALPADLATPYMCAVPVGTPLTHQTTPLPMAGPYYIDPASYLGSLDATFSLLKNPNYGGARPQTLPEFDFEFGVDATTAVNRVSGANPTADLFLQVPLSQRASLQSSYGQGSAADQAGHQQYFSFTSLGTKHLVLNTRSGGKLTDPSVRRAISEAIDRNALASAFGDAPTDQYEPNGIAGFQEFSLYDFTPTPSDVADAQARMQAAGFGPSNHLALNLVVQQNAPGSPMDNFAHDVQGELASIYVDVAISTPPSGNNFFTYISNNPTVYDLTQLGWNSDNSDPENMLAPLLEGISSQTPGNTNWSRFDDPNVNARFSYERGLTGSARLAELANMDADVAANYAPLAAFSNPIRAAITTERLGCFVPHAIYAVSLPRLCERGSVPANGTYSSGSDPSPSEPVATIQTPTGGDVTVSPGPRSTDTGGYRLLDGELSIEAPNASPSDPLRITFQLDAAAMAAAGVSYTDVVVLRNGVPVQDCTATDGTATPDPCLSSRTLDTTSGDATFVVLTSHASTWAFGAPDSTPPVLNSASLSASTFFVGGTTTLNASAASDAEAGELFVDTDAGPGLNSALNGGSGSFSSPPFGSTLSVGTHTVGVRVRDEAGNWSAPILLTLTVQPVQVFSGFFAPIKNPPAENKVKPGSTVVLGFSLGYNYGPNPLAAGYPQMRSYTCGATPSGTYTSVPQSSLRLKFDTTSGRYNLSWNTPKNSSGCREMLLRFTGGIERTVRLRFS